MNDPRFGPHHDAQSSNFLQQSHEYASDSSIPISQDEVLSNLNKLDRDKLIELLFRQREVIQGLEQRSTADRKQMTDQLSQMTENYNRMRYRYKLKEIRVQEVMAQLKQFKDNHAPCYSRLRDCLMDPGLNRVFEKMKEQVEECKRAKEEALNDMQAWTFTSESQTGKRLIARCKKLLQENEEFNKQVTSGNIAKLNAEIETHKQFIQNMQNRENDYDALLVEMDEELDAVTSLCKAFEYKLQAKDKLVSFDSSPIRRSLAESGDNSQKRSHMNTSAKLSSTQKDPIEPTTYEFVEIPIPDVAKRTESVHNGSKGEASASKSELRCSDHSKARKSSDVRKPKARIDGSDGARENCVDEGGKKSKGSNEKQKPVKLNDAYKDEMASFGPNQIARGASKSAGHSVSGADDVESTRETSRRGEGRKKQKKNGSKVEGDQSNLGNDAKTRQDDGFRNKDIPSESRLKRKGRETTVLPRAGIEGDHRTSRSPRLRRKLSRTSRSREARPKTRRIGISPPRYRSDYRTSNVRRRSNSRNRR